MAETPLTGCLPGGCNPGTEEANMENQIMLVILESLLGAGCGILAAYLANKYWRAM